MLDQVAGGADANWLRVNRVGCYGYVFFRLKIRRMDILNLRFFFKV